MSVSIPPPYKENLFPLTEIDTSLYLPQNYDRLKVVHSMDDILRTCLKSF